MACLVTSCALVFDVFTSDNDCNKLETIPSRAWTSDGTLWASGGKSWRITGLSQTVLMTACLCESGRLRLPRVLCTQCRIPATSRRTSLRLTPSSLASWVSDSEPSSPTTVAPPLKACLLRRDSRCRSLARSRCWSPALSSAAQARCCASSARNLPAGPSRGNPALLSRALTLPIRACTSRHTFVRQEARNRKVAPKRRSHAWPRTVRAQTTLVDAMEFIHFGPTVIIHFWCPRVYGRGNPKLTNGLKRMWMKMRRQTHLHNEHISRFPPKKPKN
jgi:hypothetical protein